MHVLLCKVAKIMATVHLPTPRRVDIKKIKKCIFNVVNGKCHDTGMM